MSETKLITNVYLHDIPTNRPAAVYQLAGNGYSKEVIALELGISNASFNRLMKVDKRVASAYKNGRARDIQDVVNALKHNAIEKMHVVAQIFFLKNRDPDNWSDRQEMHHVGNVNVSIAQFTRNSAVPVHNSDKVAAIKELSTGP